MIFILQINLKSLNVSFFDLSNVKFRRCFYKPFKAHHLPKAVEVTQTSYSMCTQQYFAGCKAVGAGACPLPYI